MLRFFLILAAVANCGVAQSVRESKLENGLNQLESHHLTLITDLPIDQSIREIPVCFDQAVDQWGTFFRIEPGKYRFGKATTYLMRDRQLFVRLGVLPEENSNFRHGYQYDDRLYVMEQPSEYYRRHLLLHEGTHWFLWKYLGGNGPPWFSEGLCEYFGTHRWNGSQLEPRVIPDHSKAVPYWGRFKMIRDDLQSGAATSLDDVLNFSDTAHRTDAPYAWSWAAVIFFMNHPRCRDDFEELCQASIERSSKATREARRMFEASWPELRQEWTLFVHELDYGTPQDRAVVDFLSVPRRPLERTAKVEVAADAGWQSTGLEVTAQRRFAVKAGGRVVIQRADNDQKESDWQAEPHGITLRYHQGRPLGMLQGMIVPKPTPENGSLLYEQWQRFDVESPEPIECRYDGLILMRINESSSTLRDNRGEFHVTISAAASR